LDGEEHNSVANCYQRLGLSYYWNENYEKSIKNFKRSYNIRENLFGLNSEGVDDARFGLGKSYYYADKEDMAKLCFSHSLHFRNNFFGKNSEESKKAQEWLNKV